MKDNTYTLRIEFPALDRIIDLWIAKSADDATATLNQAKVDDAANKLSNARGKLKKAVADNGPAA